MDITRPQRKRTSKEHFVKRTEERTVNNKFQIQLKKDGGSRKYWTEMCGLWLIFHME